MFNQGLFGGRQGQQNPMALIQMLLMLNSMRGGQGQGFPQGQNPGVAAINQHRNHPSVMPTNPQTAAQQFFRQQQQKPTQQSAPFISQNNQPQLPVPQIQPQQTGRVNPFLSFSNPRGL